MDRLDGCFKRAQSYVRIRYSQFGRVVKAWDLKSHGVTRAGSNPAADVLLVFWLKFHRDWKVFMIGLISLLIRSIRFFCRELNFVLKLYDTLK